MSTHESWASRSTDWLNPEDRAGLLDLLAVCEADSTRVLEGVEGRFSTSLEFQAAARELALEPACSLGHELLADLDRGREGDWRAFEQRVTDAGARLARTAADIRLSYAIAEVAKEELVTLLVRRHASEPERLIRVLSVARRLFDRALVVITEAYLGTQKRALEEQRRRTEQAHLRFSRLFEAGVLGILVCDLVGNILEANDGFLNMVGYSREEVLSGQVRWADMTPPEWKRLDDVAVEQLIARGVTRPWEKEYFRKDGSRVPILVGVAMLNDSECVAFVLDITERKRLEELRTKSSELETQNRRIREASRLKSEFLANMSHELRTPLNSIIGFAELLYQGEVPYEAPEHHEFLGDILKSGRHLLQLINDVLDLAKVEAGKMDFCPERVNLAQLSGEVLAVLRSIAATKRLSLELELEPALPEVTIDPARLKQLLYNYLSNAVKFTPEGGRIVLRTRDAGPEFFRVEVEDTGIGIAAGDFERLFVEFQQLDGSATKRHAGTGLGLALTKRMVEAQGGSVGLKSVVGSGSLFFALLPKHASQTVNLELSPAVLREHREGAAKVLVVEDDARDRALLLHTLNGAGYDVEAVATGQEAVELCGEREYAAITLDLLLADTTGLDVLHRIRSEGKNRETPIVVVSVIAERGVVGAFSVHDYLQKPVNGQELLGSLKRVAAPNNRSGTILVVDDDPSALKLMSTTLRQCGYGVECVHDPAQALDRARSLRPAVVILDLLMPGMDGFEFLLRFRTTEELQQTPVIVWTMKDLSARDHAELHRLAQGVIAKGAISPIVEQLHGLLSSQEQQGAKHERASQD